MAKINFKSSLSKGLKTADKLFNMFDTVAIVDKVSKNTAPILEKVIDRHYDQQQELVAVPDLRHLKLTEASQHLEELGLTVCPIEARPRQLDAYSKVDEVVDMVPKSGKVKKGSLIKLYFASPEVIRENKEGLELVQLKGLSLEQATAILEERKITVVPLLLTPNRKYAKSPTGQVLDVFPKIKLLPRTVQPGRLVKLLYLDAATLKVSQDLEREHQKQIRQQKEAITQSLENLKDLPGQSLDKVKKILTK